MEYTLEQLIPVVAMLFRKFTSGESTSVTYERANSLLEAVLYCIGECESGNAPAVKNGISAEAAYHMGYEMVVERVKQTRVKYNDMIVHFDAYGNENYYDTVTKALPGFFLYYNVRFAPQENLITMDYPTLLPVEDKSGIRAIEKYVAYISLEQKFLGSFPTGYVKEVLRKFHKSYQKLFCNLCRILLRNMLGHMLIGMGTEQEEGETEYEMLKQVVSRYSGKQLETVLEAVLCRSVREKWKNDIELEEYLKADMADFATELVTAVENDSLKKVVVF